MFKVKLIEKNGDTQEYKPVSLRQASKDAAIARMCVDLGTKVTIVPVRS